MSFYDGDGAWAAPGRPSSWEQPQSQNQPPSRSGASSSLSQTSESNAFASQFEEIDRATDNLIKSGKWYPGGLPNVPHAAARRDGGPGSGRGFDHGADHRSGSGGASRHQSVSDFDAAGRPGSAGLQGYYQGQRFPSGGAAAGGGGGRPSEAEQMLQAKRRMAAQRERELRNYHQEQQYNRVSGTKNDRALSPTTMSEEDRRDLIARQHRALYGDTSTLYSSDGSRPSSQDVRASAGGGGGGGRNASPLQYDAFGNPTPSTGGDPAVQMPQRDAPDTNPTGPTTNAPGSQPASRTSNSSPAGSPDLVQTQQKSSGVAPIGTRPQGPAAPGSLNKRSTTPLTPSSLNYGFTANDGGNSGRDERAPSAVSKQNSLPPPSSDKGAAGLGTNWGGSGGGSVWGSGKGTLAVQPSVWG